jgi:hypothetical protein
MVKHTFSVVYAPQEGRPCVVARKLSRQEARLLVARQGRLLPLYGWLVMRREKN